MGIIVVITGWYVGGSVSSSTSSWANCPAVFSYLSLWHLLWDWEMKISKWAKQAGWVLSRAIYCTIVIPGQDHDRNERQSCACLPNLHLWGLICCLAHKKQSNITLSRELMAMMMKSQMKAKMDQNMVTRKTAYVFTRRVSSSGITNTLKGGAVERKKGRSGKIVLYIRILGGEVVCTW